MRRISSLLVILVLVTMTLANFFIVAQDQGSRDGSRIVTDIIEISNGLPNSGSYSTALFVDLNGDNFLDIVGSTCNGGGYCQTAAGLGAYTSNIGLTWSDASTGLPTVGSYGIGAVGDVNNDMNMDLVVPYENWNSNGPAAGIEVWEGNGGAGGSVQWTPGVDPINTRSFDGIALDDADGDGNLDIAGSDQNAGIRFWEGNGGTGWTEKSTGLPVSGSYHGLVFADLNEDNLLDIMAGRSGGVRLFTNDGDGTWTDNSTGLPATGTVWNVRVADFDNDGNLDLVYTGDNLGARVFTSNGGAGGTFTWTQESTGLATTGNTEPVDFGHVDLDGNLDLLVAKEYMDNGAELYLGNGGAGGSLSWTRTAQNDLPTNQPFFSCDIEDFDGDGDGDMVLGGSMSNNGLRAFKTIATPSARPLADAGPNQEVWINTLVTLNGSASTDDTNIILYDWNITTQPVGSTATLSDEAAISPTFTPAVAGDYVISLNVKDEDDQWALNEATVTIQAKIFPNEIPKANAGPDQTATIFTLVQLDGVNSTDDAGIAAYDWNVTMQPDESQLQLSDDSLVDPTFKPEYVGEYRITLTVKDVNNTWAPEDTVRINVVAVGEYAPLANAGPPLTIELGDPATLNGTGSSDDIGVIFYNWTITSQPMGSNIDVLDIAEPTINPPELGVYNFELRVRDTDNIWSEVAYTHVKVIPKNLEPSSTITAPLDGQEFLTIDQIVFDGGESEDPEGGKITYKWESSIEGVIGIEESFERNLTKGTHTIALTVTDDHDHEVTATVQIIVKEDLYPAASLSVDPKLVLIGEKVSFDGSGSSDPEAVVFEYLFDYGDGKDSGWIKLPKATHSYSKPGQYGATLKVKDKLNQVSEPTEEVWIKAGARPTAVLKTGAVSIVQKKEIELDASDSTDSDGNIVAYYFDFGDKTNSGWINESKIKHPFEKSGRYTISVKVRDEDNFESEVDMITITVTKKQTQDVAMDMTLPIILAVVIIVITVVSLIFLKKRTEAKVDEQNRKAQEAARPKEDFTEVDSYLAQTQDPSQQHQQGYDQQHHQQGYDQQQYQQGGDQQYTQDQQQYQQSGPDQTQQNPPPDQEHQY